MTSILGPWLNEILAAVARRPWFWSRHLDELLSDWGSKHPADLAASLMDEAVVVGIKAECQHVVLVVPRPMATSLDVTPPDWWAETANEPPAIYFMRGAVSDVERGREEYWCPVRLPDALGAEGSRFASFRTWCDVPGEYHRAYYIVQTL